MTGKLELSSNLGAQACDGSKQINGMTCSASSEFKKKYNCQKAIDGNAGTDWATNGQGAGAWIKLDFDGMSTVTSLEFTHRAGVGEMFADLSIEFSNGETAGRFALDNNRGGSKALTLQNSILSSYVKITATSHYSEKNNGFSEIKVYGCPGKQRYNMR